jgi:hypothetical protein
MCHDSENVYVVVQQPMVHVLNATKVPIGTFDTRGAAIEDALENAFRYAERSVGATHPGSQNDRYGLPAKSAAFIVSPGDGEEGTLDIKIIFPEGTDPKAQPTPVVRAMILALNSVTGGEDG